MSTCVRARRPADLPVLADLLAEQQPASRYPFRWPLPVPVEEFLVRGGEEASWVAELDGVIAGHVSVGPVSGLGDVAQVFRTATGCSEPALVSVLFTGTAARGRGVGGALLDAAVAWTRERNRVPVLDVVQRHSSAVAVYRHRGWVEVGRARFPWLPDEEPDVLLMALPSFS